jgi:hypothetical protein
MKVINFKAFKDVPVCVRVLWGISFVLILLSLVTIILSLAHIYEIERCISLMLCVAGMLINNIGLRNYKEVLYKEI